jgi:hypothetical protein
MRILSAVVQIPALSMFDLRKDLALRHTVASQLVGHDHPRHILQTLQQAPEEALWHLGVPEQECRAQRRADQQRAKDNAARPGSE